MKKVLTVLSFLASLATASPSLVPMPLEFTETAGSFYLQSGAKILYSGTQSKPVAEVLAKQLRAATGYRLPVLPEHMMGEINGSIILRDLIDPSLKQEGYRLEVASNVLIEANESAGLFYGAQTLRQLLPAAIYSKQVVHNTWEVANVRIRDIPRFGWRGMHLDVSRHFMPKDAVKKFIDTIAALKLNVLHWHLTDDQGWRIEIKQYPKLTSVGAWRQETLIGHGLESKRDGEPFSYDGLVHGGYYSQEDIREIVAYAAARHVMIVPEIDMPGHMQAAIAAYPELGCTTEPVDVMTRWGVSEYILNPELSTIEFFKNVLTEVMALFPSDFIHIGGDEATKEQWKSSPRVQELIRQRGLKDEHAMQSWFIKQLDDFLVANGRRLIGWDEISEGGLARNAAITWWRGGPSNGEVRKSILNAIRSGHDVVVAPTSYLYFDYYQSDNEDSEPFAIGGHLPLEKVYHFDPALKELKSQELKHVLGAQGQLWTEYMKSIKQVEYMAFPRACALAELVWIPQEKKDFNSFIERMQVQENRFDSAGVNYRAIGGHQSVTANSLFR